ncbi:MAG: TonB-dependent receptor plug domain-containing protein [Sphingomonas sp.]
MEDLLNSLPQVFAGQGSNISNGSSGTATVNLRGLGSERNLVLVNGRRLLPGDPGSSAADLNAIRPRWSIGSTCSPAALRRCTAPTRSRASSTSSWIRISRASRSTPNIRSTSTRIAPTAW